MPGPLKPAAIRGDTPLALTAFDEVDLAVVAACLQDALVRRADMAWEKKRRRFAFVASRFLWESETGDASLSGRRVRTGVHFNGVQAVKLRGMPTAAIAAEVPLVLLTIATAVDSTGTGTITLLFAGETSIRLEVECVECHLRDLGPAWETSNRPDHGVT